MNKVYAAETSVTGTNAPAIKDGRVKTARIFLGTLSVIILISAGYLSVETFIPLWEYRSCDVFAMEGYTSHMLIDKTSAEICLMLAVLAAHIIPLAAFPNRTTRIIARISSILMWGLYAYAGLFILGLWYTVAYGYDLQGILSFIAESMPGIAEFFAFGYIPAAISACIHIISTAEEKRPQYRSV